MGPWSDKDKAADQRLSIDAVFSSSRFRLISELRVFLFPISKLFKQFWLDGAFVRQFLSDCHLPVDFFIPYIENIL